MVGQWQNARLVSRGCGFEPHLMKVFLTLGPGADLKNVGLPNSYLPTQNRPKFKTYNKFIAFLRILFFFNFPLILLTNPSLKSVKAVF